MNIALLLLLVLLPAASMSFAFQLVNASKPLVIWAIALPYALLAGLAIAAGRKGGALRALSGATSLLTTLLGLVTAFTALRSGLDAGTSLLTLAPSAIGAASMVTMAVKTATVAFRRAPDGGRR